MNLAAVLSQQSDLAAWIDKHHARGFVVDRRTHIALACFDLAIEHHAAMCLLGQASLYGSLYALIRVEFEAYARGLWVLHAASDEQIAGYERDKIGVTFGELLRLVEKEIGATSGPLTTLKSRHWDLFCSFTHTGYQALVRRVGEGKTGVETYKSQEVAAALRLAGTFALLAASALSGISRDAALIDATLAKMKEYAAG